MALRRETGSSASDDEPRRGDAQDKRRIGPSPDRPTQVIVHRPRVASTSQQEEITTKTFEHAGTEPTNMTLPQPNLGHHHRRCLTRLHPEHPDLRLTSCQPRSHVCLSRRRARRGSPPSRRRPQEGTRRRIDAVVRSHRIKAFTRRREPEAAKVVELHDRPPRRTATSTDAARSGFRPEQTNHHTPTRPDSETKIEKRCQPAVRRQTSCAEAAPPPHTSHHRHLHQTKELRELGCHHPHHAGLKSRVAPSLPTKLTEKSSADAANRHREGTSTDANTGGPRQSRRPQQREPPVQPPCRPRGHSGRQPPTSHPQGRCPAIQHCPHPCSNAGEGREEGRRRSPGIHAPSQRERRRSRAGPPEPIRARARAAMPRPASTAAPPLRHRCAPPTRHHGRCDAVIAQPPAPRPPPCPAPDELPLARERGRERNRPAATFPGGRAALPAPLRRRRNREERWRVATGGGG
nr:uncharacterized protein LOC127310224 [Lolium perenne]